MNEVKKITINTLEFYQRKLAFSNLRRYLHWHLPYADSNFKDRDYYRKRLRYKRSVRSTSNFLLLTLPTPCILENCMRMYGL